MKVIYLQNMADFSEWREYRYRRLDDLKEAFEDRCIFLGQDVEVGNFTYLGVECSLHDGVRAGEESILASRSVVGEGSMLGKGVELGFMACVGEHCSLGDQVYLADGVVLQGDDRLGAFVQLGTQTRVGRHVDIGQRTIILDRNILGGKEPLDIGQGVWIGACNRVECRTVGDGVRIGRDNYLAAQGRIGDGRHIGSHHYIDAQGRMYRNRTNEIEEMDRQQAVNKELFDGLGRKLTDADGKMFPPLVQL